MGDESLIKLLSSVVEYDTFETIFGVIILYIVFDVYLNVYQTFEGKSTLGFILSIIMIVGAMFLNDGLAKWKGRYVMNAEHNREKREYEKELHKKRMESLRSPYDIAGAVHKDSYD